MDISERLKIIRKRKGLTQKELAQKTQLSIASIQGYEQGKYKPKIEQILKLSSALGVSILDLDSNAYSNLTLDEQNLVEALNNLLQNKVSENDLDVLQSFITSEQAQRLMHTSVNIKSDQSHQKLISVYNQLNQEGQTKALAYIEDLARISEYVNQNKDTLKCLSVHVHTNTDQSTKEQNNNTNITNDDNQE